MAARPLTCLQSTSSAEVLALLAAVSMSNVGAKYGGTSLLEARIVGVQSPPTKLNSFRLPYSSTPLSVYPQAMTKEFLKATVEVTHIPRSSD